MRKVTLTFRLNGAETGLSGLRLDVATFYVLLATRAGKVSNVTITGAPAWELRSDAGTIGRYDTEQEANFALWAWDDGTNNGLHVVKVL